MCSTTDAKVTVQSSHTPASIHSIRTPVWNGSFLAVSDLKKDVFCRALLWITSMRLFGWISQFLLSKNFFWGERYEHNFPRLRALGSPQGTRRISISLLIFKWSATIILVLSKIPVPSSWRDAIQRPLWQEEENLPRSAYSEARPICIWIKDVRRRRCVLSRTTLPCRHGVSDRRETAEWALRMETSERCAHLHAACLKLDMSRAADYGRRRRKTFLFLFLFFFSLPLF